MSAPNPLQLQIENYIAELKQLDQPGSIDTVLQIVSNTTTPELDRTETAKVRLHYHGHYVTMIINVPGNGKIAKQSPYMYSFRIE